MKIGEVAERVDNRLITLKDRRANDFYRKHGFKHIGSIEYDNVYVKSGPSDLAMAWGDLDYLHRNLFAVICQPLSANLFESQLFMECMGIRIRRNNIYLASNHRQVGFGGELENLPVHLRPYSPATLLSVHHYSVNIEKMPISL